MVLAAVLPGCTAAKAPPADVSHLLLGSIYSPVDETGEELRAIASVRLQNTGESPVVIDAISIAGVDPGVSVSLMGFGNCQRGCVGAEVWAPDIERRVLDNMSLDWPLRLEANKTIALTLLLKLADLTALERLKSACRLGVERLVVRIGRSTAELRGPAPHVAGVVWPPCSGK